MKTQPHIPMSPSELPQQRVHEVVPLPARPQYFECRVGYGEFLEGAVSYLLLLACVSRAASCSTRKQIACIASI
jgi:hypothetical protein